MCSKKEDTKSQVVPNYLAGIAYLKTLDTDVSLLDDSAVKMLSNLSLPPINISRSKWTLDSEKYSTTDGRKDLGHVLRSVNQNKSIYLKPLDAWLDGQTVPAFSYSNFGSYLSYAFPVVTIVVTVVVRIYRRQGQL